MKNRNFIKRLITGICLIGVMVPAVLIGGIFYLCVSSFLAVVATFELMNMFYKKNEKLNTMRFVMPIFSLLIVVGLYFAINNELVYLPLIAFVLGILVAMSFGVFKDGTEASDIVSCISSLTYGGLLLGCAFSVEYLKPIKYDVTQSSSYVGLMFIYVYGIVVCTDVFAYVFGMLFGKHRLCVKISPKKSVEGAVAGLILGAAVGTVLGICLNLIPYNTISDTSIKILVILGVFIVSMLLSATSQLGDLVASKLKRTYEIKDYGFIFPGHGGVMDRFDSLIFSGSLFFVLMQAIYLIF